ncbi:radical SAM family heme chaperone HemW [Desulfovibrio oxamicus]|uniref:Heme chaperone HemW n=2 Tax=Nitratidesulfovibrio oxamicus TaxID=32016 RepID=A0ABS0J3Q5_9BACT|nr:radical SAM family heme chaperone HemW [Nitratidesulfovibrio oxamicus]MBG3877072.1 radical SAM family heme chaperone HemW [Nitratidesulfovibrio oxamicus]
MLLYIHVPFCRRKCRYCAFHSLEMGTASTVRDYVETLLRELALWGDRMGGVPVTSIFFGGGTPSLLPARTIGTILDRVGKAFAVQPGAEISMEANPESLTRPSELRTLLKAGVNRLSMGVQCLDDAMLHTLGRPHRAREALDAFRAVRAAGFQNVGMDLIWGLPGQTLRQWMQQLKEVVRLRPDHLSCYGLTLEPGTPLEDDCATGRLGLPPERAQAAMFMDGAELLETEGYIHYEISNFARMGFQCRHNLGYWEGEDYLGLGPSAASTLGGLRWNNPEDHAAWTRQVDEGRVGTEAERLTPQTRVLELIMLRLRTARGLRVKAYRELTGRDFLRDHKRLVHLLHREGLLRIRDGYLRLTRSGMLVSNSILERLFEDTETLMALPVDTSATPLAKAGKAVAPDAGQIDSQTGGQIGDQTGGHAAENVAENVTGQDNPADATSAAAPPSSPPDPPAGRSHG